MKREYEDDSYMGQIGTNVPLNIEEKEEDLLECIYLLWRNNKPLTSANVALEMNMKKRELSALIRRMVRHRYLEEPQDNEELKLTDYGKVQGAECLERHQKLTEFLQMVSGMNEKDACDNACRMEHYISKKGMEGICDFLKYGDVYDRIIRNLDLSTRFEVGTYEMCMGIYEAERRLPRILAKEFEQFRDMVQLEVGEQRSYFRIYTKKKKPDARLWYKHGDDWVYAEQTEDGYKIPTEVFSYTVSANTPMTDGFAVIAYCDGEVCPVASDCREVNVHLHRW